MLRHFRPTLEKLERREVFSTDVGTWIETGCPNDVVASPNRGAAEVHSVQRLETAGNGLPTSTLGRGLVGNSVNFDSHTLPATDGLYLRSVEPSVAPRPILDAMSNPDLYQSAFHITDFDDEDFVSQLYRDLVNHQPTVAQDAVVAELGTNVGNPKASVTDLVIDPFNAIRTISSPEYYSSHVAGASGGVWKTTN